jgi:hypothetical protein
VLGASAQAGSFSRYEASRCRCPDLAVMPARAVRRCSGPSLVTRARKQPLPPCACLVAVAGCYRRPAQRGGHEPITSAMKRPCSVITLTRSGGIPPSAMRSCTSGTPFASSSRVKVASINCVEIRANPPRGAAPEVRRRLQRSRCRCGAADPVPVPRPGYIVINQASNLAHPGIRATRVPVDVAMSGLFHAQRHSHHGHLPISLSDSKVMTRRMRCGAG